MEELNELILLVKGNTVLIERVTVLITEMDKTLSDVLQAKKSIVEMFEKGILVVNKEKMNKNYLKILEAL